MKDMCLKKTFRCCPVSAHSHLINVPAATPTMPNNVAFGARQSRPIDRGLQSQIEVTYFTTNDPSAFISERAGISRSGSTTNVSASQFVARLEGLLRDSAASIRKKAASVSYLGQMAGLYLEREPVNATARMIGANWARRTRTTSSCGSRNGSMFIKARKRREYTRECAVVSRGYLAAAGDGDLRKNFEPGQTAVFKAEERRRNQRSGTPAPLAITLRSSNS